MMSERGARIGAEVTEQSAPGLGTTLTLTLPLHPVTQNGAASADPSTPPPNAATESMPP